MVKVLIDVDLNKLTDEELEAYLSIKKKSKDNTKYPEKEPIVDAAKVVPIPVVDDLEELTIIDEPRKSKHKYPKRIDKSQKEKWFEEIQVVLGKHPGMSFTKAFKRVTHKESNTWWSRQYLVFCKKKNSNPHLKGKEFKPDKRKEPGYMLRHSPYLQWKNEHVAKVMKYNKMNIYEATAYLGSVWSDSGKTQQKATELLETRLNPSEGMKVVEPKEFPLLKHLTSDTTKLLQNMIRHIVDDKTLHIGYVQEGGMLGIDHISKWHEFTSDFMFHKELIKEVMGLKGDFILTGITGVVAIRWEG